MENVWFCPLCESKFDHHHFFQRVAVNWKGGPIQITYAICDECGLVFLWDRLSEKDNEDYYMKGDYRTLIQGTPTITPRVQLEQTSRAECLLPYIDHEPKSVLDVGASTGIWLDVLQTKFDCEVLGIEPGEHFRIKSGVKMFSELALLYTPEYYNSFDMITCIHTLEHMNDPIGFLVALHEFITEDGVLYIEVPHLTQEHCLSISHPICFTPDTLTYTLHRAGWAVEWLETYNSFKTSRTLPPNILVKAYPDRVDDIIPKPDLGAILREFNAGMAQLEIDREAWEKANK